MTPTNDIPRQPGASNPPRVVKWFKVYCGVICVVSFCRVPASWMFFLAPPRGMSAGEAEFMGLVFLVTSLVSFAIFVVPFCVEKRPWVWTYNLVLICLGFTSLCSLLICVPLLISWIKPEVKRYYGKTN